MLINVLIYKLIQGTKAWFKDEEEGFVTGTLSNRLVDGDKVELTFIMENTSDVC